MAWRAAPPPRPPPPPPRLEPQIRFSRQPNLRRHYSNDGHVPPPKTVHRQNFSHHIAVAAETAFPKTIAQNGHGAAIALVFVGQKSATDRRPDTERGKKPRRNIGARDAFGAIGRHNIELAAAAPRGRKPDRLENVVQFLPINEIAIGHPALFQGPIAISLIGKNR